MDMEKIGIKIYELACGPVLPNRIVPGQVLRQLKQPSSGSPLQRYLSGSYGLDFSTVHLFYSCQFAEP